MKNEYLFLSLFSGGGLGDLGLERAGFKCKGQVEINKFALKILKRHWPNQTPHRKIILRNLGNGITVPVIEWICKRIIEYEEKVKDDGEK